MIGPRTPEWAVRVLKPVLQRICTRTGRGLEVTINGHPVTRLLENVQPQHPNDEPNRDNAHYQADNK